MFRRVFIGKIRKAIAGLALLISPPLLAQFAPGSLTYFPDADNLDYYKPFPSSHVFVDPSFASYYRDYAKSTGAKLPLLDTFTKSSNFGPLNLINSNRPSASIDLNGDGRLDLVKPYKASGRYGFYYRLKQADDTFGPERFLLLPNELPKVQASNGSRYELEPAFCCGPEAAGFEQTSTWFLHYTLFISFGDFNGDGIIDIAYRRHYSRVVNAPADNPSAGVQYPEPRLTILFGSNTSDGLLKTNDGYFYPAVVARFGTSRLTQATFKIVDLNQDGFSDIVVDSKNFNSIDDDHLQVIFGQSSTAFEAYDKSYSQVASMFPSLGCSSEIFGDPQLSDMKLAYALSVSSLTPIAEHPISVTEIRNKNCISEANGIGYTNGFCKYDLPNLLLEPNILRQADGSIRLVRAAFKKVYHGPDFNDNFSTAVLPPYYISGGGYRFLSVDLNLNNPVNLRCSNDTNIPLRPTYGTVGPAKIYPPTIELRSVNQERYCSTNFDFTRSEIQNTFVNPYAPVSDLVFSRFAGPHDISNAVTKFYDLFNTTQSISNPMICFTGHPAVWNNPCADTDVNQDGFTDAEDQAVVATTLNGATSVAVSAAKDPRSRVKGDTNLDGLVDLNDLNRISAKVSSTSGYFTDDSLLRHSLKLKNFYADTASVTTALTRDFVKTSLKYYPTCSVNTGYQEIPPAIDNTVAHTLLPPDDSIKLDGTIANDQQIVGVVGRTSTGQLERAVYFYKLVADTSTNASRMVWQPTLGRVIHPNPAIYDSSPDLRFGQAIGVAGESLLVSSSNEMVDSVEANSGKVYWFKNDPSSDNWEKIPAGEHVSPLDDINIDKTRRYGSKMDFEGNFSIIAGDKPCQATIYEFDPVLRTSIRRDLKDGASFRENLEPRVDIRAAEAASFPEAVGCIPDDPDCINGGWRIYASSGTQVSISANRAAVACKYPNTVSIYRKVVSGSSVYYEYENSLPGSTEDITSFTNIELTDDSTLVSMGRPIVGGAPNSVRSHIRGTDGVWKIKQEKLEVPESTQAQFSSAFGYTFVADGNRVVVSEPQFTQNDVLYTGRAHVYERSNAGSFLITTSVEPIPTTTNGYDLYSKKLSISTGFFFLSGDFKYKPRGVRILNGQFMASGIPSEDSPPKLNVVSNTPPSPEDDYDVSSIFKGTF